MLVLTLAVVVVAILAGISGPLAALVGFILALVALVGVIWLWVKAGFLGVAAAVAPRGASVLRASFDRSVSKFWPVLGRMLILFLITTLVGGIISSVSSPSYLNLVTADPSDGMLMIDDTRADELDEIELGDFAPFTNTVVITSLISSLLSGAVALYSLSGYAALYADLNGPSDYRRDEADAQAIS